MKKGKGIFFGLFAADAMLLAGCFYLYTHQDRTVPVISFDNSEILYTDEMDDTLLLQGVSAYDEQDGDVSSSLLVEKVSKTADGQTIITYAAKDASNNVAKISRILLTENAEQDAEETLEADPEAETEGKTESVSDEEENQEDEQSPDGAEAPETDRRNGTNVTGTDRNRDNETRRNEAPVLKLNSASISVSAGAETVDWNSYIQQLTDDSDSRAQLFANLVMEGHVELNVPGSYPVVIYTKDSEGAESERQNIIVNVE